MRAFVFFAKFIIAKCLKQEVDESISFWSEERSTCGFPITGDIKIYQMIMMLLPLIEKCPMDFHQGVVFNAQT